MNEDSGTAYDSTAHGLDGIPSKGTNELADISQMVAYENGACGRARVNGIVQIWCGNYLMVPSYDALKLEDNFSVSIWVNGARVNNYYPKLISRKVFWRDENGWELLIESESRGLRIFGSSDRILRTDMPDMITAWMNVQLVYDANIVSCYTNGIFAMSETIAPVVDNGLPLCFGCNSSDDSISTFCGQYDEIRLRGGSLSADRIKADYDMIVNRNFLRYRSVENGKSAAE